MSARESARMIDERRMLIILAPESVKEQYRQMIEKADEDIQESE